MGDTLPPEVDRKVPGKPASGPGEEEATLHNGDVEMDSGGGDARNCLLKDINCSPENHTMKKVNGCGDSREEQWTEDCDRRSNSSPLSKNDADNQMDWEDSQGSVSNPMDSRNSIDNVVNGEDRESKKNTQNGLLDKRIADSGEAENKEPETLEKTDSVKTITNDEGENDSVTKPKNNSVASPAHQQDVNNCIDNSDSVKDNFDLLSEGKNDCSGQNDEVIVQDDTENDRKLLGQEHKSHSAKVDLSEVGSASVNDSEKSGVDNQEKIMDCDDAKSDKGAKSDEPSKSAEAAKSETSLSEKAVKSEEATQSDKVDKSEEHAKDVENQKNAESSSATAEKISNDSDETKGKSPTSDTVKKMDTESEVSVSGVKGDKPSDNADEKKDECKKLIISVEHGQEKASESILKGKITRVAKENIPLRKGPPVSSQRTPNKNVPKSGRKSELGSPVGKPVSVSEVKDFRPVAKILVDLGTDLVRQHIYKDLIKIQSAKQSKAKLTEKETAQLETLKKAHKDVALKNDDLVMNLLHCPLCLFKTESLNVMEWHKECAHMRMVGVYMCAFCQYDTKQILHFIAHVKAKHNRNGRLDLRLSNHLCPLCPFEDNSVRPYRRHIRKCEKAFFPRRNLMPSPADCDIPIKSLPAPVVKTTEKRPWPRQPRNTVSSHLAGLPTKASLTAPLAQARAPRPPTTLSSATQFRGITPGSSGVFISPIQQPIAQRALLPTGSAAGLMATMGTQYYALLNQLGQPMLQTAFRQGSPVRLQYPQSISQASGRQTLPVSTVMSMYQPRATVSSPAMTTTKLSTSNQVKGKAKDKSTPTTVKPTTPVAAGKGKASTPTSTSAVPRSLGQDQASMFHVCEICGGYVKDRESLRIHFYWAHRVDIHKDVFQRDPQLFCKNCPMRFWTYQGLSRHRQLVHPNKDKQPEKPTVPGTNQKASCYLCGTKELVDLNVHLVRQHKTSIQGLVDTTFAKSKCYFCGLEFKQPQYAVILVHLQENHGQFTKEVKIPDPSILKPKTLTAIRAVGAITPIRNNTPGRAAKAISPAGGRSTVPVPTGMFKNSSIVPASSPKPPSTPKPKVCKFLCFECDKEFEFESDYERHCAAAHQYNCTRCSEKFQSQPLLEKHYSESHRGQKIRCPLCDDNVPMGRPYLRHMKREHIKECSVVVPRMARDKFDLHMAQLRKWEEVKLQKKQEEEKKKKVMVESKKALPDDDVIVIDLDDTADDEPPPAKKPKVGKPVKEEDSKVVEEVIEINGEKVKIVQEG